MNSEALTLEVKMVIEQMARPDHGAQFKPQLGRATLRIALVFLLLAFCLKLRAETPTFDWNAWERTGSRWSIDFSVIQSPAADLTWRTGPNLSVEKVPISLWLLVDSASVCQLDRLDERMTETLQPLKQELTASSEISVVSFTDRSLEILQNRRSPKDLELKGIECQKGHLSTSPEEAIKRLLAKSSPSSLPTYVWILTSGNILFSPATVKEIAARDLRVRLLLYNPILKNALAGTVDRLNTQAGRNIFRIEPLLAKTVPERWFRLRVKPSVEESARIEMFAGGKPSAQTDLRLPRGAGGGKSFWERALTLLLLLSILGIAIYCLVRYYRERRCNACQRVIRYADGHCLFCGIEAGPALLSAHKEDPWDLTAIGKRGLRIGTSRRADLRVKGSFSQRGDLLRITHDPITPELCRIERKNASVDLRVNGSPVTGLRYLSDGDRIDLQSKLFFFVQGGAKCDT